EQGYQYFPQYEDEMPDRRFFKKIVAGQTISHVHMVEFAGEFWQRHLLFRDYLRANPDVARQYAELKIDLAKKDWQDSNDYCDAKSDFIRRIEKQAMEGKSA
ncbi:MAG TPA: GrpB family protein, partial [Sedimentisphaerales bacterium]|nr:GrpB family protein [Sedimentisphaerales bacterium]